MSYTNRQYASHLRHASLGGSQATSAQSSVLAARISEKKAELENLKELQELSAHLATQMESLEKKLATLSDGTEAVAAVLSNWHNVLRAINMASARIPKPKEDTDNSAEPDAPLPQTLVRIPAGEQ